MKVSEAVLLCVHTFVLGYMAASVYYVFLMSKYLH